MASKGLKARAGRFLKGTGAKLLSDAAWVMSLRVLRQVMSLVVVAVLVRVLTKHDFGQFQFALTMVGALSFTVLPGITRSIVQAVARGHDGTFRDGTKLTFRFSFFGFGFLFALAGWFWWRGDDGQALAIGIAALLFPSSQGLNQWQSLQVGRRQYRENTVRISIGVIGSSLAMILGGLFGVQQPWILVGLGYGVLAVQNFLQQRIALASIPKEAEAEPGAIAYGLKSSVWDAINVVANYADRILVYALRSPVELAAYAVADRLPEQIKTNVQQFQSVMIPRFAARDRYTRALDRKLNKVGAIAAVGILAFAFGVVPFIFPLLFTEGFADSAFYCQLILISTAIGTFATIKNSFISARLDLRGQRNILAGSAVIRLVSSGILVWLYGALGAAISTIVYRTSMVMLIESHMRRHYLDKEDEGA